MRRMLDPTKVGDITKAGRHWYCITNSNKRTYYTIITARDYDFPIGKFTSIEDLWTNDKYKALHAAGAYPGAGLLSYGSDHILMTRFDFENDSDKMAIVTGIKYETNSGWQQKIDVSSFFGQYIMKIF